MPATAWTPQAPTAASGVTESLSAIDVTNGNSFVNNGDVYLRIVGGTGATGTMTIKTQTKCSYGDNTLHDITITLTNGLNTVRGFFPPSRFNDAAGSVQVTFSGGASVGTGGGVVVMKPSVT